MTLIDRYLAAVAAQLPADARDDVTAELRDDIMSRVEAREASLGRSLTDDEVEAILREVGHPLAVAGRYGSGPQQLIGPELYPWWLFGVKIGLAALVLLSLFSVGIKLIGGQDFGQVVSQGFSGLFDGGLTLVGLATLAGFVLERQKDKPEFLRRWRVRDLSFFEATGRMTGRVEGAFQGGAGGRRARPSPVANALASAAVMAVVVLWWAGVFRFGGQPLSEYEMFSEAGYSEAIRRTIDLIWWPFVGFGVSRILLDLVRAANGRRVRAVAFGEILVTGAWGAGIAWLLALSPVGVQLGATTLPEIVERLRQMFQEGLWTFENVVVLILAALIVEAACRIAMNVWRLVTGRGPRVEAGC